MKDTENLKEMLEARKRLGQALDIMSGVQYMILPAVMGFSTAKDLMGHASKLISEDIDNEKSRLGVHVAKDGFDWRLEA